MNDKCALTAARNHYKDTREDGQVFAFGQGHTFEGVDAANNYMGAKACGVRKHMSIVCTWTYQYFATSVTLNVKTFRKPR